MKGKYVLGRTVFLNLVCLLWNEQLTCGFGKRRGLFPSLFSKIDECWINFEDLEAKVMKSLQYRKAFHLLWVCSPLGLRWPSSPHFHGFFLCLLYPPVGFFLADCEVFPEFSWEYAADPLRPPCKNHRQEGCHIAACTPCRPDESGKEQRGLRRCCQLPAPCAKLILSLKEIYCIFTELYRKFRFIVHALIFLYKKSPGLNKGCWKKGIKK